MWEVFVWLLLFFFIICSKGDLISWCFLIYYCFLYSVVRVLVWWLVMIRLELCFNKFCVIIINFLIDFWFNDVFGLFINKIEGLRIYVCVIVMCCFFLLESIEICLLVSVFSLIICKVVIICVCFLCVDKLLKWMLYIIFW